jgi:hypothetical protein
VSGGGTAHEERLHVPAWWTVPALGAVLVFGALLHGGLGPIRALLSYGGVALVVAVGLAAASTARVRVADGVLEAGGARLPLEVAAGVHPLDRLQTRRALGPEGDPTAYVVFRAWVPGSVLVELADPDDPTPYWLVSTRHPDRLAAAVEQGRREASGRRR